MPNIKITPRHVPAELADVNQPIQILSDQGRLVRQVILLREGEAMTIDVPEDGRYMVRAELPSGETFAAYATSGADEADLDLCGDVADQSVRYRDGMRAKRMPTPQVELESLGLSGNPKNVEGPSMAIDSFTWNGWRDEGTIRLRPVSYVHDERTLPCTLERIDSFARDTGFNPLYLYSRIQPENMNSDKCVILWPPFSDNSELQITPVMENGSPAIVVNFRGVNPNTEVLFNAMLGGSLENARETLKPVVDLAHNALYSKMADPITATLASYVLWKAAPNLRENWVENLANQFPNIADAAILHGWRLIASEREEEAIPYFLSAIDGGIPVFTEGIRLQLRGLNFLSELFPQDKNLEYAKVRAHRLFASASMESEVTCFKLGEKLQVIV